MLTVERLTKRYGSAVAVDDVTFTARPGRVTGFLGPNGAGKSTTMRLMVGLTRPTTGTATVLGPRFTDRPTSAERSGSCSTHPHSTRDEPGTKSSSSPSRRWA